MNIIKFIQDEIRYREILNVYKAYVNEFNPDITIIKISRPHGTSAKVRYKGMTGWINTALLMQKIK